MSLSEFVFVLTFVLFYQRTTPAMFLSSAMSLFRNQLKALVEIGIVKF